MERELQLYYGKKGQKSLAALIEAERKKIIKDASR